MMFMGSLTPECLLLSEYPVLYKISSESVSLRCGGEYVSENIIEQLCDILAVLWDELHVHRCNY